MRKSLKIIAFSIFTMVMVLTIISLSFYKSDIPTEINKAQYFTENSRIIKLDRNKLHVKISGNGPAIFLIHGSFSSLHTWKDWQNKLSKSFTVVSMDLPGHGLTGSNPQSKYDTDYYASLMFKLADKLNIDNLSVAGNSMGGQVAYKMAILAPQRISNLILLNSSGINMKAKEGYKNQKISVFSLIKNPLISKIIIKITPRFLLESSIKQVYYDDSKINDEKIQRYYDLLLNEGNRKATIARLNQKIEEETNLLKEIQTPTLILWGQHDEWIPVSHAAEFHKLIPNSCIKIYANAGHIPMEEIPDETVKDALKFLSE
ncbi:alpha/beta hydrolase [Marivirga sp.]|uniref:alpha/beta fold hydrolase n=1 Tax=Marivirga sp. TaxID=2018662 RepID=UPI002D7FE76E|nr:alpha/beta hydrolase [Marivirga sp.]HET8860589.1 alpha/beta hydrolase [Marivirga sp.]